MAIVDARRLTFHTRRISRPLELKSYLNMLRVFGFLLIILPSSNIKVMRKEQIRWHGQR